MAGGLVHGFRIIPGPPPSEGGPVPDVTHAAAAFRQIVMPDLVVIDSKGITSAALDRVRKIRGLRGALAVDGASLTVSGHRVNAIGVDGQQYRSWTPLRTASNESLWSSLDNGGFAASPAVRRTLRLHRGRHYTLAGSSSVSLPFGGAAPLGTAGIDLVVSNRYSGQLGLIHNVAALVSAPGVAIGALRREVRAALGPGGRLITLRQQQQSLPVDSARSGARPSTYLELFRESAAQYCPGMSWTILAAIGQIESGDGTNMGPSTAGALGPMQFLPSTWKIWGIAAFGEPEPPSIMDPYDAVPSAARYLCAAGASTPSGVARAIYAYNHATWYVNEVLALARQYAQAYG
jgi:Transglycosylase SLT domain